MNRRAMLVATSGVVTTALTGCIGAGSENPDRSAQAGSPTVEERTDRTVVVSNTGEVAGEPDLAILDVGVESTGESASAVRDDLATRSDDLREALLEYGIDEDAISTNQFRIHERVDRQQMEEDGVRQNSGPPADEYTYYEGTHSFTVDVSDIDAVGEVIDVAVDGGADAVGRVTYTLSDDKRSQLREEALQAAIRDARSEAESIAAEVDGSIVEATVVDASEGQVSPVRRDLASAADASAGTPSTSLDPGDVTVTATVEIQYEME